MRKALFHDRPPYVPWACGFTVEAKQKLVEHFGSSELEDKHAVLLSVDRHRTGAAHCRICGHHEEVVIEQREGVS